MNEPLVSIIMPVYNAEKYISDAIESVIDQTYKNWELLVIDDGSGDKSIHIISVYAVKDKRVKIFSLAENSGSAIARNKGIAEAAGKYIAFLDCDDMWKKNKLQEQIKFMLENKYAFSFSAYELINTEGKLLHKKIKCPAKIIYKELLKANTVGCLTAIYDAEMLGKMYMPDIKKRQDYGLWLNILKTGITGYGLQNSLAFYRKSSDSLSGNKLSVLKYNWHILRRHQNLSFLSAVYYFSFFLFYKTIKFFS